MAADADGVDAMDVVRGAMLDGCDPDVATNGEEIVVTMYGRPFQLSERAARTLAFKLIAAIDEMDRSRRF
ncbi:MAG: hypothetical protein WC809_10455 [Sinimarinibacterium sp.]|jgi:hypothetical protein